MRIARSSKTKWVAAGIGAVALVLGVVAVLSLPQTTGANPATMRLGRNVDGVTLVNDAGESVRWGALKGRPRALFFGFTHCPVVCPVTVWELNDALDKIGAGGAAIDIEFVTIDPERDTPQRLHAYFSGFEGRVHSYTGSAEAIARLARAFDISYQRQDDGEGDNYSMDHTATVFLLDVDGRVRDVIGYGSPPDVARARLSALIAAPPPR